MEAMGAATNVELAEMLGVARVIAADIRARGIPARWLLRAVEQGYNPTWIETGRGPKHLIKSHYNFTGEHGEAAA